MWDEPTVLEHIEADRIEDLNNELPQQAEASRDDFIAQHILFAQTGPYTLRRRRVESADS